MVGETVMAAMGDSTMQSVVTTSLSMYEIRLMPTAAAMKLT